jgi:hypothetical protein
MGCVDCVDCIDWIVCVDCGCVDCVGCVGWVDCKGCPVAGFNLKENNNKLAMVVIKIKGMETISHETIPKPCWQSTFNKSVKMALIQNSIMALLYCSLYVSIMTCVKEYSK